MKKGITVWLILITLVLGIYLYSSADTAYKVTVDVEFVRNAMFSKYDVDVYLNNTFLTTLPHGEDYYASFDAYEGSNTLNFFRNDDHDISGSLTFDIRGNTAVDCTISCTKKKIEISEIEIKTEEIIEQSSPIPTIDPTPIPEPDTANEPSPTPVIIEVPVEREVAFSDVDLKAMTDEELAAALTSIKEGINYSVNCTAVPFIVFQTKNR